MDRFHAIDVDALRRTSDYTGLWQVYWPNGQTKYRGYFDNGIEIGQHTYYFENGVLAYVFWCDSDGSQRGTSLGFSPEGEKDCEETWNDPDRRPGTFERRDYDTSGEVFLRSTYLEYAIVDDWRRPRDNVDTESQREIDRIVADAVDELERRLEGDEDDFDGDDDEGEESAK